MTETACEFRIQQILPPPPGGGSFPGAFLGTSYTALDKIVRRLSETKQPSSWHPSGPRAGGHCRFQVLCTEGKESRLSGHLTLSGNIHIHIRSLSPVICGIVLLQHEIFPWLCSVSKRKHCS